MAQAMDLRNQTLQFLTEFYPQSLGSVPEDVLDFGLPDKGMTLFFVVFVAVLMAISVTGNSIMIYLYGRYKTLRTPANKLVINLALANMLMHGKSWILIVNGIDGGPLLGDVGKKIVFVLQIGLYLSETVQNVEQRLKTFNPQAENS